MLDGGSGRQENRGIFDDSLVPRFWMVTRMGRLLDQHDFLDGVEVAGDRRMHKVNPAGKV